MIWQPSNCGKREREKGGGGVGGCRGVAPSNYVHGAFDKVGGQAHEPRDGYGCKDIERQLWIMDGPGEACGSDNS